MNSYPSPELDLTEFDPLWHSYSSSANVLQQPGSILLCPTNETHVMGAGLALKIKKRWPAYAEAHQKYQKAHALGGISKGIFWWKNPEDGFPCAIVSCPTKSRHFDQSSLDLIEASFRACIWRIARAIEFECFDRVQTVMVPKLGCGLGGLEWEQVLPILLGVLQEFKGNTFLSHTEFVFCGPPPKGYNA